MNKIGDARIKLGFTPINLYEILYRIEEFNNQITLLINIRESS